LVRFAMFTDAVKWVRPSLCNRLSVPTPLAATFRFYLR
jgi:hypothetical protein